MPGNKRTLEKEEQAWHGFVVFSLRNQRKECDMTVSSSADSHSLSTLPEAWMGKESDRYMAHRQLFAPSEFSGDPEHLFPEPLAIYQVYKSHVPRHISGQENRTKTLQR